MVFVVDVDLPHPSAIVYCLTAICHLVATIVKTNQFKKKLRQMIFFYLINQNNSFNPIQSNHLLRKKVK